MNENRRHDSDRNSPGKNQNLYAPSPCPHTQAARQIHRYRAEIKDLWENRVREQILEAEGKSSLVLRNDLDIFLDQLCDLLESEGLLPENFSPNEMALHHGQQRTGFSGYLLPQLLKEFSILREVIFERLHLSGLFIYELQNFIGRAIDSVISSAATEFVATKQREMRVALTKAETSNRDLEHFAAIAAHDLKE